MSMFDRYIISFIQLYIGSCPVFDPTFFRNSYLHWQSKRSARKKQSITPSFQRYCTIHQCGLILLEFGQTLFACQAASCCVITMMLDENVWSLALAEGKLNLPQELITVISRNIFVRAHENDQPAFSKNSTPGTFFYWMSLNNKR